TAGSPARTATSHRSADITTGSRPWPAGDTGSSAHQVRTSGRTPTVSSTSAPETAPAPSSSRSVEPALPPAFGLTPALLLCQPALRAAARRLGGPPRRGRRGSGLAQYLGQALPGRPPVGVLGPVLTRADRQDAADQAR